MTITTEQLKPCPFCGSPAICFEWSSSQTSRRFYRAACDSPNPPGCPAEPFTDGDTEAEAAADWNKRAPIAQVERLREALKACGADYISRPCTMSEAAGLLMDELHRRADLARTALQEPKPGEKI